MQVIVVGGGIAGASLAFRLSVLGARVTVLERENRYRDRVRGELLYPWGVVEAGLLGVADALKPVSKELRNWATKIQPLRAWRSDLTRSATAAGPAVTFAHPVAQEALVQAAAAAGAEVLRGVVVTGVEPGVRPAARVRRAEGKSGIRLEADLVVGADGRGSVTARTAGFSSHSAPETLVLAGALCAGASAPDDTGHVFMRPEAGLLGLVVPLPGGRHRMYAGYHTATGKRNLSGPPALPAFGDVMAGAGMPAEWLDGAELAGPLAEFSGAETWAEPAGDRVALIGDAAAVSDPSWGCGLALALRDARVLADALAGSPDLEAALRRYAGEHAVYHDALRRQTKWLETVFRTPGPQADALRRAAMPKIAVDPSRAPDVVGAGPEGPSDEAARRRFFGED
ncbi:MAG TPA: FAD-dependent oxidoreductase [Trueperaceae bacterium]